MLFIHSLFFLTTVITLQNRTSEDLEKIRSRLAKISLDDPDHIDDVISEISFTLSEKSTTISQLQTIIEELKAKENDQELVGILLGT